MKHNRRLVLKLLGLAPVVPGLFIEAVSYQHPISFALAVENFINWSIRPDGGHVDIIKDQVWSKEYSESIMGLVELATEMTKQQGREYFTFIPKKRSTYG